MIGASSVFVYLSINLFLSLSNYYFLFNSGIATSLFGTIVQKIGLAPRRFSRGCVEEVMPMPGRVCFI